MMDVDLVGVGERVRAARMRAGLSQRDVQSRTHISQSTLHRIETGTRTTATLADIDRLAQVIEVGLDELLYGSAVQHRVLAAARTGDCLDEDLRAALGQGIELLELDALLDAVVPRLPSATAGPVLRFPHAGRPRDRGAAAATLVRKTLGLDGAPVADLGEAVEQLTGVDVGAVPLPAQVSGVCATDPERQTTVVLVNSTDVAERQRFTLAHELGHLLLGDATHVDSVDGRRSSHEVLCDEFARHLLIPRSGVHAWLTRTVGTAGPAGVDERTLALLARHFGVSPEAARVQLDRMELITTRLRHAELPSGRRWAYRYGWGPQFDDDQASAQRPRAPRRILERATEAYRAGKLGIRVLAKLQHRPVNRVEQALSDVAVERVVRHADMASLVERARDAANRLGS